MYKTYFELFPRRTETLGPVCANSGIAESGIRAIDCSRVFNFSVLRPANG